MTHLDLEALDASLQKIFKHGTRKEKQTELPRSTSPCLGRAELKRKVKGVKRDKTANGE